MRELHALLKAKDPSAGFSGLVCVMINAEIIMDPREVYR
jgi:hypothetical protein